MARAWIVALALSSGCHRPTGNAQTKPTPTPADGVLRGADALGDWTTDRPGVRRHLTIADLPPPNTTPSADHGPTIVPRPEGALPKAPPGFVVSEYASGFDQPRVVQVAPNGDVFVVESRPGRVQRLRDGKRELFLDGLTMPFGLAFHPPGPSPTHVYVANTDSVIRVPYPGGGEKETIVANIPSGGKLRGGGHWTRDVVFSNDGKRMFVSVGSFSNVDDGPAEARRACILAFDPDGKNETIYAQGLRNAVGLAVHPTTGELWASVNERDELGDHLVPDYVTHVIEGAHYGWPWFYLGDHQDPRHAGKHPELAKKVVVPDVLLQSHSASLGMTFYTGTSFPAEYRGDAFAAEHGSWNRARRTGYKVIRIPMKDGHATGEYEDFLTGFVANENEVWGRPVGVAVAKDGALLVTDDGGNRIWRVAGQP
ncbi:MAG: PQQ-dependent sugar dehydrogenase [Polyangiales bacterium]